MECPACGSQNVHASRSRGAVEKAVRAVTHAQHYRCHACGHRERVPLKVRRRTRQLLALAFLGLALALAALASGLLVARWLDEAREAAEQQGQ